MTMNNLKAAVIGAALGFGILGAIFGPDAATRQGIAPQEDEPGWSCATMGNRVCGPGNEEGAVPGCYDHNGELAVTWPCKSWRR